MRAWTYSAFEDGELMTKEQYEEEYLNGKSDEDEYYEDRERNWP